MLHESFANKSAKMGDFFTTSLLTMCAYICMHIVALCLKLEVKFDHVIDHFA